MTFLERGGKPESVQTWDQITHTLRVDTTQHIFKKLTDVTIDLNVGNINVTNVEEPESTLRTSIVISADSEEAAKAELREREKSFSVKHRKGRLEIDASQEVDIIISDTEKTVVRKNHISTTSGEAAKKLQFVRPTQFAVLEKRDHIDYIGAGQPVAVNIEESKVTIDRKPIRPGDPNLPHIPEVKREVDLFIADSSGIIEYNLETQAGNVDMKNGRGGGNLTTLTGKVHVDGFDGEIRVVNPNGNTEIKNVMGSYGISGRNNEVFVKDVVGDLYIDTEKGDIVVKDGVIVNNSYLHSDEGTIRVSARNGKDLKIIATTAGEIHTPSEEAFKVTHKEKKDDPKKKIDKNRIEGHLITSETPVDVDMQLHVHGVPIPNDFEIFSGTGNIVISKSE